MTNEEWFEVEMHVGNELIKKGYSAEYASGYIEAFKAIRRLAREGRITITTPSPTEHIKQPQEV